MATFRDLRAFVTNDGWTEEPNLAQGRHRTGDHRRSFRDLPDGTRLRTKVSHDERAQIGQDLFNRILRDQLRVTEARFWHVVRGTGGAARETPAEADPIRGWLATRLLFTVGLSEADVRQMSAEEARAAWFEYRTRLHGDDAG